MTQRNHDKRLRLYLIRHGEVEGAASGRLLGWTDTPLSNRGLEQSRELAETLSTGVLSAVYSSDLQRTRVMAESIAKCSKLKVQESPAWREINMGQWDGRTMVSMCDETPQLVARLFDDPASFEYPGGESFACFTARVLKAVDQLLMTHKSGEVVLVAHGGVCRAIIGSALGIPAKNWLRLAQDYSCLNVIDWYDGNPILQLLNLGYGGVCSDKPLIIGSSRS
jgi:alpha-ribazole phosphatase